MSSSVADARTGVSRRARWEQWRTERETALATPDGWLSLVGFAWLGSEPAPVSGLPGQWWSDGEKAYAGAVTADRVVDGEVVDGIVSASVDEAGSLRWLTVTGTEDVDTQVELVRRGGRYAVRLRREDAPTLRRFDGVPTYDYDELWVVGGVVRPYSEGPVTVEVGTAREDLRQAIAVDGEISVVLGGHEVTLRAADNGDGTWRLLFHDETSGAGSALWRTVSTGPVDEHGHVTVDFNRTLNLPFAFTDFGTCPAPPPDNVVPVAVTAGERAPR